MWKKEIYILMKKFGDLFNDFILCYKKENPEVFENNADIFLYNNWDYIIQKIPEKQSKKILQKGSLISFFDGVLIIAKLNSAERFILQTKEKKVLQYINQIVCNLAEIDGMKKGQYVPYVKKVKFH